MANPLSQAPVLGPNGFVASEWQRWFDQLQRSVAVKGQPAAFGAFGANGKTPQPAFGLPAAAVDLPSVIALTNSIRAALIANGIAV